MWAEPGKGLRQREHFSGMKASCLPLVPNLGSAYSPLPRRGLFRVSLRPESGTCLLPSFNRSYDLPLRRLGTTCRRQATTDYGFEVGASPLPGCWLWL